jgi:hypothetical protein
MTNASVLVGCVFLGCIVGPILTAWAERVGARRRARRRTTNWIAWSCISLDPDQRRWCPTCQSQGTKPGDLFRYWPCRADGRYHA